MLVAPMSKRRSTYQRKPANPVEVIAWIGLVALLVYGFIENIRY